MKSISYILLFLLVPVLDSCKDRCEFVEPVSICETTFSFTIIGQSDTNVFNDMFDIEKFEVLDSTLQPVNFSVNPYRKFFNLNFFDCELEKERFEKQNSKTYYLKFGTGQLDEFVVVFKPIHSKSECGGTQFEELKFIYKDEEYDARNQSAMFELRR